MVQICFENRLYRPFTSHFIKVEVGIKIAEYILNHSKGAMGILGWL